MIANQRAIQKKRNIHNIIDNDDEIGEVAEWAGVSAAQAKDDDDFDFDNKQVFQQSNDHIEQARQKINQKLNKKGTNVNQRNGPLVNNLKDKAKSLALQNNQSNEAPIQQQCQSSDDENEKPRVDKGEESPDKKVFRLSERSIGKIEEEFEQANKVRMMDLEKKKNEVKQISFIEVWDQMKGSQDIRDQIEFIQKKTSFLDKLFGCFSIHLKSSRLIQEKNQVCLMSQLQFDDNNESHFRILYTIYCQLMTTDYCLRYGSHWEMIGFQGTDPATDLRGAGILGLLQILAFISEYKIYFKQTLKIFQDINIPFSITLINITTFVLVSLKDNKLNQLINQEDSVISVINKLYFAGFHLLTKILKKEQITFHTIGVHLTHIRKQIHEQPQKLIREFHSDIQRFYKINNV
ncbi:unnamed protein product (macronuclear) [Paramecium tetraurelia]|uniref:ELMO domain-containing protein n=1 Tax=Paramecium tetraurelia TaxID=5888 RepID=A0BN53_PARTE|nr:uncharacterized protein GSPATT00030608001 [Paramecium tetraurelia]CAK59970.1 unnamed protein product [Paramecium tetraurelia]|eukprot:XP_001427368.1 hypothetical protein (macronuclear) [Paramecium tetraurelia strain d4-2]